MARALHDLIFGRRGASRFVRDSTGASAVEFAFVVPMLVALSFSAIDGGRALLTFNSVERLARDGARYASVRGSEYSSPATEVDVTNYLKGRSTGLDNAKLGVSTTWTPDNDPGSVVAVQVTYPFDTVLLPFDTIDFERTSTLNIMR